MKLGARILKTGIAIILAVSIASLLPHSAGMVTVAGIAAVVAMQPSVYRTFKTIVDQFQGNVIGALRCSYGDHFRQQCHYYGCDSDFVNRITL